MAYQNAAGINVTGVVTLSSSGAPTGSATTQYGVQVGSTSNALASITPDASTTKVLVSGGASANPSWQDISGGALALGAFGSSPNADGASLSGSTLTLQPANGSNPGGVSTTTQTLAGAKTFSTSISSPEMFLTGGSSGTISILPQAAAGTYNFNMPVTAGTSGYVLTSAGGGSSPMTWTQATATPTASVISEWDSNVNMSANSFIEGYNTTVTSGGTLTLTVSSAEQQFFTGSTNHTCVLPVVSTLVLGQSFIISNLSSGNVTVQSSGGGTLATLSQAASLTATVVSTSGTGTNSWFGVLGGTGITTVGDVTSGSFAFNGAAGSALTSISTGFDLEVTSKGSGSSAKGGYFIINAGAGGTNGSGGAGGDASYSGGQGGGSSGAGGSMTVSGGAAGDSANGGDATFSGGTGGATSGNGGDVYLVPGEPANNGSCGNVYIGNVTADGDGTNIASSNVEVYIPQGTGSGSVGKQIYYGVASGGSSGGTGQTSVQRLILNGSVALVTTVASTIATLTLASGSSSGGCITYLVECTDGTDYQSASGIVPFSAINKSGTKSGNVEPQDEAQTRSAGTLTNVFSVTSGGLVQITSTTSLTPTFYQITYEISCLSAKQSITVPT